MSIINDLEFRALAPGLGLGHLRRASPQISRLKHSALAPGSNTPTRDPIFVRRQGISWGHRHSGIVVLAVDVTIVGGLVGVVAALGSLVGVIPTDLDGPFLIAAGLAVVLSFFLYRLLCRAILGQKSLLMFESNSKRNP